MVETHPKVEASLPKRRRLSRAAVIVPASLVMLYLVLPSLIPRTWIAAALSSSLRDLMTRPVEIDSVTFGYLDGLRLKGLRIARRSGFGAGSLLEAEDISMPMASHVLLRPAKLLLHFLGSSAPLFKEMRIDQARFWIVANQDGDLNIADFNDRGIVKLPSGSYILRRATMHFEDHRLLTEDDREQPSQKFVLPYLKCVFDPRSGRANWSGGSSSSPVDGQASDTVSIVGDLSTPRLSSDVQLSGGGSIQWRELDLNQIPRLLIPFPEIQAIQGTSYGSIEVSVAHDLEVLFNVEVGLQDTQLTLVSDREWILPDRGELRLSGSWNPRRERLEFSQFTCDVPGVLRLQKRQNSEFVIAAAQHEEGLVSISLEGSADSLAVLTDHFPEWSRWKLPNFSSEGRCELQVNYTKNSQEEVYEISLDATNASFAIDGVARLPSGESKRATVALEKAGTKDWSLRKLALDFGQSRCIVDGSWPIPGPNDGLTDMVRQWVAAGHGRLEITTSDLAELFQRMPILPRSMPRISGTGAMSVQHEFAQSPNGMVVTGEWRVGDDSDLKWGEALHKQVGKELTLSYSAIWQSNQLGTLENVTVDVRYGDTCLSSVSDDAKLSISTSIPESRWDREKLRRGRVDVTLSGAVEVSNVEDGLTLLPSVEAAVMGKFPAGYSCEGPVLFKIDFDGTLIDQKPAARFHLEIDAERSLIELADVFLKPADSPLKLDIDYIYDHALPQPFASVGFFAALEGGQVHAVSEWSLSDDGHDRWNDRDLDFALDVEDWGRLLEHWPAIRADHVSGAGRFSFHSSRRNAVDRWQVQADLTSTGAAFAKLDGLTKPPGVLAELAIVGRLEKQAEATDSQRLLVEDMSLALGSSNFHLDQLSAEITQPGQAGDLDTILSSALQGSLPMLNSLQLAGELHVLLDSPLPLMSPTGTSAFENWVHRYGLRGSVSADVQVDYDGVTDPGRGWSFAGLAHGSSLIFDASPWLAKTNELPTELEFDVRFSHARDEQGVPFGLLRADLSLFELRLGDISMSLNGEVAWRTGVTDPGCEIAEPYNADLAVAFDVPQLERLERHFPALTNVDLAGGWRALFALEALAGDWRVDSGLMEFAQTQIDTGSANIQVDGMVRYEQGRWMSDSIAVQLDGLRALASGGGCWGDAEDPFQLAVRFDDVDRDEFMSSVRGALDDLYAVYGLWRANQPLTFNFDEQLSRAYVSADVYMDSFSWTDSVWRLPHTLEEIVSKLDWRGGGFDWQVRGACSGGLLYAHLGGLREDYDLQCVLSQALPSVNLDRWLRFAFPGLRVAGTIDYTYNPGVPPDHPLGEHPLGGDWSANDEQPIAFGEIIVRGGALQGKAAPNWVTSVFPGLNLAKFRFGLMHDWFTEYAGRRILHQAIFQGEYYHLYATGWQTADGTLTYEIGIDLLAGLDSRYWTSRGNGRIPIFISTTRLDENGQVAEESVNYVPLELIKAVLWGANPIRTAYSALRKKISEKR